MNDLVHMMYNSKSKLKNYINMMRGLPREVITTKMMTFFRIVEMWKE